MAVEKYKEYNNFIINIQKPLQVKPITYFPAALAEFGHIHNSTERGNEVVKATRGEITVANNCIKDIQAILKPKTTTENNIQVSKIMGWGHLLRHI